MKSDMIKQQHKRHYEVQQHYGLGITRMSGIEIKNGIKAKQTENYRQESVFPHGANWLGDFRFSVVSDNFADYLLLPFLLLYFGL